MTAAFRRPGWARRAALVALAAGGALAAGPEAAPAQCLLANPSFEIAGSAGAEFAGWNQFGAAGSSPTASHGARAARVSGPDGAGWSVSAFWQRLDCAPGDRWAARVRVAHSSARPLTGGARAIVNVEWRDAAGDLISYESHEAADPTTPTDELVEFAVESAAAPPGTAATHFLLGVLQGPGDPSPDVLFDEAAFDPLGPPTLDELQWADFAGGREIGFAGRTWRAKGPGFHGPGPSLFGDGPESIWVDAAGRLHLTIRELDGAWRSSEVALADPLGYGDYRFTTAGALQDLDPRAVLGLFLWQYGVCYDPADGWWNPYNEIDVEIGRFGNPASDLLQFVVQPWDFPGNLEAFDATFVAGELATHAFLWLPDRVEFRSWRGGPLDESPASRIREWTYAGPHLPRPEQPRVHVNLWQHAGVPPVAEQEVVLADFVFVPEGAGGPVDVPIASVAAPPARLAPPRPNPFRSWTAVTVSRERAGGLELAVHDVAGRRVRTLLRGRTAAGSREVVWDGRDDAGTRVASGVYVLRLRAGDAVESRRVVLTR